MLKPYINDKMPPKRSAKTFKLKIAQLKDFGILYKLV